MTTTLLVACLITFATVIATVRANSGAAGALTPSADGRAQGPDARVSAPERCSSARRGLAFYSRRYGEWRARMGAGRVVLRGGFTSRACPRYLAQVWKRKSFAARLAFERWHDYHYNWRSWLPDVWKAIIACETFSNFRHNSGTYQGAYGFHYGSWDRFRLPGYPHEAYLATPRQQYEVALAIWRRYGFTGWGCA